MSKVIAGLMELISMRGCLLLLLVLTISTSLQADEAVKPRKIVLIAGKKSHGPGAHDYERTMRLFKVMLDNSNVAEHIVVEEHEQGWPADERTLDDADTIVFYSDGRDGDKYADAPFVEANRMTLIQKQIERGCGMMTMHFSTFVNDEQGQSILDWIGGYFDWEDDAGKRNWYSKISQIETLELAAREHPISRGVPRMVQLRDEVYWKLRFRPDDKRLQPIWRAMDVFDDEAGASAGTVAWAIERNDGGRGFGTSVGHAYRLWQDDGVRKLFLNAMVWSARAEVPEGGVEAAFYSDDQVQQALTCVEGTAKAVVEPPMKVLLFTGNKAHAWHNGEASTASVKAALESDSRMNVQVSHDIEDLAKLTLREYDAIVLNNYANWHDPQSLSDASKEAFLKYLEAGGGLVVIHFANGAFHFSLPEAGASDWPEYRKIVRRVWDHHGRGGAKSAHDAFGLFTVNPTDVGHPVTAGLKAFEVNDELYYNQAGEAPIEPLLTAKSKNTNRDEPLAWAYEYKQARVFQTLLGHSEKTYDAYEAREMLRRAVAWVARRKVIPLPAESEKLVAVQPEPAAAAVKPDHWGIEGVGFKWREEDSRDDRWKETQIGPFLASSLPLGTAGGTVAKGLSIRLGNKQQATVCYDTASGKLRAAWTGGFLKFTPARYGLIMSPLIDGEPQFLATDTMSWDAKEIQYQGLQLLGQRVVLKYHVDGTLVEESPWIAQPADRLLFTRQMEVGPATKEMTLRVAGVLEQGDIVEVREIEDHQIGVLKSGGRTICFFSPNTAARWSIVAGHELRLTLPPHKEVASLPIVFGSWEKAKLESFVTQAKVVPFESLAQLKQTPAKPHWPEETVTQGFMAKDDAAYVVDTLTIPFDNPYKALFFTSGHDAVSENTMAVCTVHGDVWLVSGIKDRLAKLRWKRFATGLFQPLGLVAKPDGIYVLGRDQITRLLDENHDGEADLYECFSNQLPTSSGGHDYTTCLETDDSGNFFFLTALQGIWRLSADGKQLDNIAGGLRNPNGLGVGPGAIITVAPQEGNWTPASYIGEAKPGDYFGFGGPKVTPDRPLGWTQPLCFIPRKRDNSSGGQVWVTSDRWGPLKNQLLHLSYGQCRPMLVLREVIAGQVQGGTVDMPQLFDSGAMRGRFNPYDGQLYVSGLRGWTTAATQDGCLQRVRYTGLPVNMPVQFHTLKNGVAITFTESLNRQAAEDLDNYHLEQWNYRYAESYGSPDFKSSDPKQEGHDEVRVESATLLADGRTVFLEIADLQPVHQLTIGFSLTSAAGAEFRHTIAYTIHNVSQEVMDPQLLHRSIAPGRLTEAEENLLQTGLLAKFSQQDGRDVRPLRMAALFVGQDEPPTQFLAPGAFDVSLSGYLKMPLKSEVQLSLVGQGKVAVEINGQTIIQGAGNFESLTPASVPLRGGYNTLAISYESPVAGDAQLRLFWQGKDFAREPIPPTAFAYRGDDAELLTYSQLRHGEQLVQSRRCYVCHAPEEEGNASRVSYPLEELSQRLQPEWIASFLLDPQKYASHVAMPRLFQQSQANDRQAVADLASWLTALRTKSVSHLLDDSLVDRGTVLYEQLNCLACHCFTDPAKQDEFDRVSLYYLNAKFSSSGLQAFLQAGHREFSLRLSAEEQAALAAYLQATAEGRIEPLTELGSAKPERGQTLFVGKWCSQCHKPSAMQSEGICINAPKMTNLEQGCLAVKVDRRGVAPDFNWQAKERDSVISYLKKYGQTQRQAPLLVQASRLVESLRCSSCHNRDGKSGARLAIFSEETETGLLPEQLPDVTWAGEKLQTSWLQRQFAGELAEPARGWMKSRMPSYKKHAELLSQAFAAEHGLPPRDEPVDAPQAELVASGEQLTLKQHLDCRQCHGIGALEPTGDEKTKLAPGINFALVKERLRPDYYRRFVLDPPRIDPSTRMVKLAPDGRTTKVTSIYDGHAPQQFEAIWNYIQSVKSSSPKR